MGVLYLVEFLKQGGVERILHQLALQVSEAGTRCYLFSYETEKLTEVGKQIQKSGIEVLTYKKKPGYDFTLLWKLAKTIREKNIGVIHTQDFGPTEYAIALKILFPRLRLVHTQHTLHYMIQYRKYLLFLQLASLFYSSFSCVSQPMKESLEKECPLLRGRLTVIPNGVDTEKFNVSKNVTDETKLHLVSVSRISSEKNLIALLQSCVELQKRNIPYHLDHIGS
jgi:glycosyltransferase involved in cell wall biosynthesis